jgi:hypothetical protein
MASCSVCLLPTLAAVNRALVAGVEPIAILARKHDVSRQALLRHKEAHLPKALVEAQSDVAAEHGSVLMNDIAVLRDHVTELLAMAKEKQDVRGAITAIREATRLVELIGRMEGALTPAPAIQVNLHQSTEYQVVIGHVIEALMPYPEARNAVVAALQVH